MQRARRSLVVLATVIAVVGLGAGLALRADEARRTDLTGLWKLDLKHSDLPGRGASGGGGRRGGMGGGGWGGRDGGWRGGPNGGGPGMGPGGGDRAGGGERGERRRALPDLVHVTQATTLVSFEDSSGAVVQEITTVPAAADTCTHAPGATQLTGRWDGDKLEVLRETPRGSVTETYSLEDKGKTLVVHTKLSFGSGPAREFKRVYQRVSET